MAPLKLTYFNLRARAELSRLILAYAGVEYEDIRVDQSRWPEHKPSTPFGQLPILEVDGVTLCQSKTIARFLATKFGIAGKTDLEKAQVDMIADCIEDIYAPTIRLFSEKDPAKQAELKDKFQKETLPTSLGLLEKLLKSNKGGDGYFVGDSLTWVDIGFTDFLSWLNALEIVVPLNDNPKLKSLKERVESVPKIAEWIKNRPVTAI
jgi:glutathione S-transferase